MKISFCTTCKGRLWQLEQTLPHNVARLDDQQEIVLLDYQSPDGLREYIFDTYPRALKDGRLKYFQLQHDYRYSSAYAKNVAHRLAQGEILFNLDADNLIAHSLIDLKYMQPHQIYVPKLYATREENEGSFGRVGIYKAQFYRLNGYNENIIGMQGDDGDLIRRAYMSGLKPLMASDRLIAIQNTYEQKHQYATAMELPAVPMNYPSQWGQALIVDGNNQTIDLRSG